MDLIDDGLDDTTLYEQFLEENPEEREPDNFESIKKLLVIGTKDNTDLIWYVKDKKCYIVDDFLLKCLWLSYVDPQKTVEMSFAQEEIMDHVEYIMEKIDLSRLPDYENFICMMIRIANKRRKRIKFVEKPLMLPYVTEKEKSFKKLIKKKTEKERPTSVRYKSWKNDKSVANFIRVKKFKAEFFYSIFMGFGEENFIFKFLKVLITNSKYENLRFTEKFDIKRVKKLLRSRMRLNGELNYFNSFFLLYEKEINQVLDHLNERVDSFFKNKFFEKSLEKYLSLRENKKRKRKMPNKRKIMSEDHNPKRAKFIT